MRVKHTGNYARRVDFYRLEFQNNIRPGTFVYGKWSALSMNLNEPCCLRAVNASFNQKFNQKFLTKNWLV